MTRHTEVQLGSDSETFEIKGMSGVGARIAIAVVGMQPGDVESLRGDRASSVLNPPVNATDRHQE
jgi:hypothetical protein